MMCSDACKSLRDDRCVGWVGNEVTNVTNMVVDWKA